jgi:hypothetical protein
MSAAMIMSTIAISPGTKRFVLARVGLNHDPNHSRAAGLLALVALNDGVDVELPRGSRIRLRRIRRDENARRLSRRETPAEPGLELHGNLHRVALEQGVEIGEAGGDGDRPEDAARVEPVPNRHRRGVRRRVDDR